MTIAPRRIHIHIHSCLWSWLLASSIALKVTQPRSPLLRLTPASSLHSASQPSPCAYSLLGFEGRQWEGEDRTERHPCVKLRNVPRPPAASTVSWSKNLRLGDSCNATTITSSWNRLYLVCSPISFLRVRVGIFVRHRGVCRSLTDVAHGSKRPTPARASLASRKWQ